MKYQGEEQQGPHRCLPTVCAAVRRLTAKRVVLDGEIVAVDGSGLPSFQALQHRSARTDHQIAYYAFDLLHLDGRDLLRDALIDRRSRLPEVVKDTGPLMSIELPGGAARDRGGRRVGSGRRDRQAPRF